MIKVKYIVKNVYRCSLCNKGFGTSSNLRRHERIHTGDKLVSCPLCQKVFNDKNHLSIHKQSCTVQEAEYVGNTCSTESKVGSSMGEHIQVEQFSCSICHKTFRSKNHMEKHEKIHLVDDSLVCNASNAKSKGGSSQKELTNQKSFSCSECHKSFSSKYNLVRHQRIHTNQFSCSLCQKGFRDLHDLKRHKRSHITTDDGTSGVCTCDKVTNDNSKCIVCCFVCSICQKSFRDKHDLNVHKIVHTKDSKKLFSCSVCDKRFTTKRYLMIHERVHTGDSSYCCTVCSKEFPQYSLLKKHNKIHTGDD